MKSLRTDETHKHLCSLLDNNTKVYYSRFGDGDIFLMFTNKKSQYHKPSSKLSKEIKESFLIDDEYYMKGLAVNYEKEDGMVRGLFAPHGTNQTLVDYLTTLDNVDKDSIFYSAVTYIYMSVFKQDLMIDFLEKYIRPKKKMYIGCIPKTSAEKFVGKIDYYVRVPGKNAYYSINEWYPNVLENIDNVEVCLPAGGMATRVLQKRLWELDKNIHSIDLGSVWDAMAEPSSCTRTWIKMAIRNLGWDSNKLRI